MKKILVAVAALLGVLVIAAAAPVTNPSQLYYTAKSGVRRLFSVKLAEQCSAADWGADSGNADNAAAFTLAVANCKKIQVPASTSCYAVSSAISLASGSMLIGDGMGGPQQGPSCISSTLAGCTIVLDSTVGAAVRDLDIRVNSTDATSSAICLKSTTGITEFNEISGVSVRETNATPRTTGQVGVLLSDNGNHGIYWNTVRRIRGTGWDTTVKLLGLVAGTQGVNANRLDDILSAAHNFGVTIVGPLVSDNVFTGIFCSRSDATLAGISITCLTVGDNTNLTTFGNHFFEVDSDQGSPSVCAVIGTKAGGTVLYADCEAGGPVQDNNTTLNPSFVYDTVQSRLSLQTIIGAASLTGTSNLVLKGGLQVGGIDGYVELGTPGNTFHAGVRIASSIFTRNKPFAPVDCAAANLTPTVSSILAGSVYTCGTAQTLTLPTAQGASGIVQSLPHPTVGDFFTFRMVSTAAANFTLVAGTGGTISGNAVTNNGRTGWDCRITSVTASSETYTCY